jgi:hypothetical protein
VSSTPTSSLATRTEAVAKTVHDEFFPLLCSQSILSSRTLLTHHLNLATVLPPVDPVYEEFVKGLQLAALLEEDHEISQHSDAESMADPVLPGRVKISAPEDTALALLTQTQPQPVDDADEWGIFSKFIPDHSSTSPTSHDFGSEPGPSRPRKIILRMSKPSSSLDIVPEPKPISVKGSKGRSTKNSTKTPLITLSTDSDPSSHSNESAPPSSISTIDEASTLSGDSSEKLLVDTQSTLAYPLP